MIGMFQCKLYTLHCNILQKIFSVSLSFLITKVGDKNISFDSEVRQTLSLLLNGCGVFEGYNDQIDIWINSIIHLDSIDDKLEVASYVEKMIKRVYKHTEKYLSLIYKAEENTGEEEMDISKQEDIFNRTYIKLIKICLLHIA